MRRLAVICARGGSKGLKGKNLRPLAGRPLISYSVEQALDSKLFEAVAVSSDSEEILKVARASGADFTVTRPDELASDNAPKIPAIRHCAKSVEIETEQTFDTIVDLDATSPLRNSDDIRGAVNLLEGSDANNVVSAMPARRSPYFNIVERDKKGRVQLSKPPEKPIVRRQDAPECFDLNASVFVWTRECLFSKIDYVLGNKTYLFVMPEERSIDIDTENDFKFVEFLMIARGRANE